MQGAVYNSRILSHSKVWLLGALIALSGVTPAGADDLATLADKFAEKIISVTGPGALAVEVSNRSSLNKSEVESVQRALRKGLTSFGARFVDQAQAAATVKVSLSEDLNNYVWIAEIKQAANESSVAMISAPRLTFKVSPLENAALAIRKVLLWSSEDRILDLAEISGSNLLILYPEQVTLYRLQDRKWQAEQSLPLAHTQPWPRDLRGRLILRKDHLFDAYLPGVFCQSTGTAPLKMNCRQSDDPWPVGTEQFPLSAFFTPARNYFTGALSPGIGPQRAAGAFYSAAWIPRDAYAVWLLASVDGSTHLLDGASEQTATLGWGSDMASVHSGCGSGWQLLASASENSDSESVRAFEISDRAPVPATQAIPIEGRISALWTAADAASAMLVSHNQGTGTYDAYRLTITCGQ